MCEAHTVGAVGAERGQQLLHRVLAGVPEGESPLTHVEDLPERVAHFAEWPSWTSPAIVSAFTECGVQQPWQHQIEAATHAHHGRHVVVATGTASGKSLAYQLPVFCTLTEDRRATALYLAPTKALAADQLRSAQALDSAISPNLPSARPASYDGDTPPAERDWVRAHARWVFTNPDMLHRGVLPSTLSVGTVLPQTGIRRDRRMPRLPRRFRITRRAADAAATTGGAAVRSRPGVRAGLGDGVRPGVVGIPAVRRGVSRGGIGHLTSRRAHGRAVGAAVAGGDRGRKRSAGATLGRRGDRPDPDRPGSWRVRARWRSSGPVAARS